MLRKYTTSTEHNNSFSASREMRWQNDSDPRYFSTGGYFFHSFFPSPLQRLLITRTVNWLISLSTSFIVPGNRAWSHLWGELNVDHVESRRHVIKGTHFVTYSVTPRHPRSDADKSLTQIFRRNPFHVLLTLPVIRALFPYLFGFILRFLSDPRDNALCGGGLKHT